MKTEIVKTEQVNEIDWDKIQLVKSNDLIVLNLGGNKNGTFKGVVLISCDYKSGEYSSVWVKNQFTPITEPITIKFIP